MNERHRLNLVRVKGYALAMCKQVPIARRTLEVAVDAAQHARVDFEFACEQAEFAALVASSGNEVWIDEVASHLEECFG